MIISLLLITPQTASAFSDVGQGDWYYENVLTLRDRGVVNGYNDNTFKPGNNVSHGESLKMLTMLGKMELPDDDKIVQVASKGKINNNKHWAEDYVQTARANGLVKQDKKNVEYDAKATRKETAEYILNYIDISLRKEDIPLAINLGKSSKSFFMDAYGEGMDFLYQNDIIKGSPTNDRNRFDGVRPVTRAEFTAMMDRAENFILSYKETGKLPHVEPPIDYGLINELEGPSYNINNYTKGTFKVEDMIRAMYYAKFNGQKSVEFTYSYSDYSKIVENGKMRSSYVELLREANNYVRSAHSYLFFHQNHIRIGSESDSQSYVKVTFTWASPTFSNETIDQRRAYVEEETMNEARRLIESRIITDDMSQLEIAKSLHKWVIDRVDYDYALADTSYDSYSSLREGKSVCTGYADLYNRMLRIFGIKAEGISGYIKNSGEFHIWTEADLDGTRYYIDSTWNDELKSMKYFTTDINLLRQERDWDETYYARYRGLVQ